MRLRQDIAASRHGLWGFVAIGLGWASFWAQAPVIKARVGLGDGAWGTLILLSAMGAMLAIWLAPLAFRVLGRWAMAAAFALMAAAFFAAGLAHTPLALGLCLFAAGIGAGVGDIFANAEISEAEAEAGRSLMNLNHGLYSLFYALAAALVALAREGGLGPTAIFGALLLAVAVLAPVLRLPDRAALPEDESGAAQGLPRLLVWLGGIIVLMAFMGEAASEGWSALHVERTLGGSPGQGSLGPALLAAGMAAGRLGAHLLGAHWPPVRVMALASGLAGVGMILSGLAPNVPLAYLGFVLGGLGVSVVGPLALGLVGRAVPARLRLAAIAQAAGMGYAAFFIGPVLMGFVAEGFGLRTAFHVIGAAMFVMALGLIPLWAQMLRGGPNRATGGLPLPENPAKRAGPPERAARKDRHR